MFSFFKNKIMDRFVCESEKIEKITQLFATFRLLKTRFFEEPTGSNRAKRLILLSLSSAELLTNIGFLLQHPFFF